jgi:hypothetical protein
MDGESAHFVPNRNDTVETAGKIKLPMAYYGELNGSPVAITQISNRIEPAKNYKYNFARG